MRSVRGSVIIIFSGILLCSFQSSSQEIPEVTANEIPDLSINRNELFDGESLWGYMNGGADIYLEYGFDILRVEEFSNAGENIKLELFKMDDPASAFGIYSIKIFKCNESQVLTRPDCLNKYQYQLLYGDYYIQLINESGSDKARQAMIDIADTLLGKLEKRELLLPAKYLTDSLNFPLEDIKMVKGVFGIQNKASELSGYFKAIDDFQVFFVKTAEKGVKLTYYEIIFGKAEMKSTFMENVQDEKLQIISENNCSIVCKLSG